MIEAIFFDIDGTLLSFKTNKIPESTIKALQLLREKGIKTFISTGRPRKELHMFKDIKFDGFITSNGQYCFDVDGEVIHEKLISKDDISKLIVYANENNIACSFTELDDIYYNQRNDLVDELENLLELSKSPIDNVEKALENGIYQISAFVNEEQEKEIMKIMPNSHSARWYHSFCDISPKGGSKRRGIEEICKKYNINVENTMAFGDGGNDIPMLEYVGTSVAMGNANPNVKEIADYVTSDIDDDGIYNALKHFNII